MAGERDLVARIRAVAALLDDAALSLLSSKGLVRRARKDLEQSAPTIVGEHDSGLRVAVEEWTVDLFERPADARCTCPAQGICRHILVALIHVGMAGLGTASAPRTCGAEILSVTDEELRRWAGTVLVRQAMAALAGDVRVECDDGTPFVARLPTWNAECRWMPDGGLAGMLCSCHEPGACVHKAAAVLAWQAEQGRRDIVREAAVLTEPAGAPRTRGEVRQAVHGTLHEIVGMGLDQLSPASHARLETLATTAHGVDLPRLERLLHGLADEIEAWLRRDAHASSESILGRAAQVEALTAALERPEPALVGRHRSRYDRVGVLDLSGMGARVWRTRSGYTGLTVYFWDHRGRRWNTWSDARPIGAPGFDPAARFTAPGPWTDCHSPAQAASSRFRLADAWRNGAGRLSGREGTQMIAVAPVDAEGGAVETRSWTAVVDKAWELFGMGLTEPDDLAPLLLLRPAAWGVSTYDDVHQELRVAVIDEEGRPLVLALAHTDESALAIERLEQAVRGRPPAILGTLAVAPISLIEGPRVISLGLDDAQTGPAGTVDLTQQTLAETAESEDDVPERDLADAGGTVGRLLASAAAEIERLAESGSAAYRGWPRLRQLGERSSDLGLSAVAVSLRRLAEAAEDESLRQSAAAACLKAAYVVRLTAATAAIAAAAAEYK